MRIYLDNCCYNRLFDDRSYSNIYYERNSVMLILEMAEHNILKLIGSEMLVREICDTRSDYKRYGLSLAYSLCSEEILVTRKILYRAQEIRNVSNIHYKDSIHLACAEDAHVDVLLTTDRKFMNNCNRIDTYIKVMNPNQWIKEAWL